MFTPTIEFWHFRLLASNAGRPVGVPVTKVLPSATLLGLRRTPHCPPGQYAGRLTFWSFSIPRWVFRRALSLRCWLRQTREPKGASKVKRFGGCRLRGSPPPAILWVVTLPHRQCNHPRIRPKSPLQKRSDDWGDFPAWRRKACVRSASHRNLEDAQPRSS